MDMTFNSNQDNKTAAKNADMPPVLYEVDFRAEVEDLYAAGILLREAIGRVKSLSDSLVGAHPLCADDLGIDRKVHVQMRKFRDLNGLKAYKTYLMQLVAKGSTAANGGGPCAQYRSTGAGFAYLTGTKRAGIMFEHIETKNCWRVAGYGKFRNPEMVMQRLRDLGFNVQLRQLEEQVA